MFKIKIEFFLIFNFFKSWPSNYAAASQALFGDNRLWQNPDLVASNDQYAWDTVSLPI